MRTTRPPFRVGPKHQVQRMPHCARNDSCAAISATSALKTACSQAGCTPRTLRELQRPCAYSRQQEVRERAVLAAAAGMMSSVISAPQKCSKTNFIAGFPSAFADRCNGTYTGATMSAPKTFDDLLALMHKLRAPGGCPWDAEQTHQSLRPYLLEEAYEVLDALDSGSEEDFRDELGDLLLQVVFHAELANERGAFDISAIITGLHDKLVRRHPHVFGDVDVDDAAEVKRNWARIKAGERAEKARRRGLQGDTVEETPSSLDGVPRALPALLRAHRLGQKAASTGLDWSTASAVRAKLDEELAELDEAVTMGNLEAIAAELGDLLFATASYARHLGIDADTALRASLDRFETRVRAVEGELRDRGVESKSTSAEEIDRMWRRAKKTASD